MATSTVRTIRVLIDGTGARAGAQTVNQALGSIGTTAKAMGASIQGINQQLIQTGSAARQAASGMAAANTNISNVASSAEKASGGLLSMAASFGKFVLMAAGITFVAEGLHAIGHAALEAADSFIEVQQRIGSFTKSQAEAAYAQQQVIDIANKTRAPLTSVGELYAKIGIQGGHLGMSLDGVAKATQNFSMAAALSGNTAAQTKASMIQLGDAFDIGKLQGRHYMAMMMDNIVFMRTLAQTLGVTQGQLQAMAHEGTLTGQKLAKALQDPKMTKTLEDQFARLPFKFADVRTAIENQMVQMMGALMKGMGLGDTLGQWYLSVVHFGQQAVPVMQKIGKAMADAWKVIGPIITPVFSAIMSGLKWIAENMDTITRLVVVFGAAWLTIKAAATLIEIIGFVSSLGGVLMTLQTLAYSAADAMMALNAVILANPLVAFIAALVIVGTLLYEFSDKIKIGWGHVATLADVCAVVWGDIKTDFTNGVNVIGATLSHLPQMFEHWFAVAANTAIDLVNGMVGKVVGALNSIGGLLHMDSIKFTAFQHVNDPGIPKEVAEARAKQAASGVFQNILGRADARRNALNKVAPAATVKPYSPPTPPADPPMPGDDKDKKAKKDPMKEAIENVQKYQDELTKSIANLNEMNTIKARILAGDVTAYADLAKVNREEQERKDILENRNKFGEQWNKLKATEQLRQNAIAKSLSDQKMDAEGLAKTLDRRNAEMQKAKDTQNEIAVLSTTDWRQAQKISDEYKIQQARQKEMAALAADKLPLESAAAQSAIAAADAAERQAIAQQRIVDALKYAQGLDAKIDPRKAATDAYQQNVDKIQTAYGARLANGMSLSEAESLRQKEIKQADKDWTAEINKLAQTYYDTMSQGITDIASVFKGKFGDALNSLAAIFKNMAPGMSDKQGGLLGGITKLLGTSQDGTKNAFGQSVSDAFDHFWTSQSAKELFTDPVKSMADGFSSFKDAFNPANGGGFMSGISKALGGAMQGAGIGSAIAPFGQMLWSKFSSGGAQIGGALGSIFGPLGSLIGSVGGGVLGGLLTKTPTGKAGTTFDALTGTVRAGSAIGKSSQQQSDAQQAAGDIASGVNSIVQTIGAQLTGMASLSITKKKNFYISGDPTVYKTEADAVASGILQALKSAISAGTLQGVSDFTKRIISHATKDTLDGVASLAANYEKMLEDFNTLNNPVGAAVTTLLKSLDQLENGMRAAGATTAELATVEQYRQLKLADILKQSLSTLTDLQKFLGGEASGKTDFTRLTEDMASLAQFKNDIGAGKTIDSGALSNLVQEITQLSAAVFGTATPQYQDMLTQVNAVVGSAVSEVQQSYNDALLSAQNQIISNQNTQTTLLRTIANNTGGGGGSASTGGLYSSAYGEVTTGRV